MRRRHPITSRGVCLRAARQAGAAEARQAVAEAYLDALVAATDAGLAYDHAACAERLRALVPAPGVRVQGSVSVPPGMYVAPRWASLYARTLDRSYRQAMARFVAAAGTGPR